MAKAKGEKSGSARVGFSNDESPPDIFKLNVDCCQEVFEYLTLYDLLNIAETCKRFKRIAGDFYRSHYLAKRVTARNGGLHIDYRSMDIFSAYIPKLFVAGTGLSLYQFIGSKCKSLRQIRLGGFLPEDGIQCIKNVLSEIEFIELDEYFNRDEFYEKCLCHCPKLKSLSVKRSVKIRDKLIIIGSGNDWLLRKYPTLEHLELTDMYEILGGELKVFFEQNPNVRTFSTDSKSLWDNRDSFLACNANLDQLAVEFRGKEIAITIAVYNLLNELHENGCYKKLHVYSTFIEEDQQDQMFSLLFPNSVEMLHGSFSRIDVSLENLTVLSMNYGYDIDDMNDLQKKLPNLERIFFYEASSDHLFPFVKFSPKLKAIKIYRFHIGRHAESEYLSVFNRERKKLKGAQKLTIYLHEYTVLRTKSNFEMVTLGRYEWFEWNELRKIQT